MTSDLGEPSVLELSHITKRFGDVTVLDDVSLAVRRGTVHALLGENGAGKTTLMRIAFGLLRADEGTLTIAGARGRIASPRDAIAAGVGMVHQHFTNVGEMTVAENVALGKTGRFRAAEARREVDTIRERSGLTLDPDARAVDLGVGGQQRLEILKALSRNARILILDEPTAVLAPAEAAQLLAWLRRFADAGNSVVLITHKLHEALSIADDLTVLRRGRVVLQRFAEGLTADELAIALLGETPPTSESSGAGATLEQVVVKAVGVDVTSGVRAVRDVNLEIRAGEIVGVAAIEGSGQHELLRALSRRLPIASGELRLPTSIGFVPEDRHRDAVVLPFSLEENVALRDSGARRGTLRIREIRDRTLGLLSAFDVRGGTGRTSMRSLSGGNQQRLVLARELEGAPELLVVENPTRGLDLRASGAVHARLRAAAAGGAAVVTYSSDVDEVLSLATRIIVVNNGRVRETATDRTVVGRAMLGVAD
jgi:simple sugar transport system ATP-binding protein